MNNVLIFTLIVLGSILGSLGNLLVKKGTQQYPLWQLWRSSRMWWGILFFIVSTLLYLVILPKVELSFVYPLSSMTYIWTTFLSLKFLGERMNVWKWIGLMGIIVGIILIGIGA